MNLRNVWRAGVVLSIALMATFGAVADAQAMPPDHCRDAIIAANIYNSIALSWMAESSRLSLAGNHEGARRANENAQAYNALAKEILDASC